MPGETVHEMLEIHSSVLDKFDAKTIALDVLYGCIDQKDFSRLVKPPNVPSLCLSGIGGTTHTGNSLFK